MERVKKQISELSSVYIHHNSLEKGRKGLDYETVNIRFLGGAVNIFSG